jgi:hypothetical protein
MSLAMQLHKQVLLCRALHRGYHTTVACASVAQCTLPEGAPKGAVLTRFAARS